MEPVAVGVIGTGALGRHHTRLLAKCDSAHLVGVYDIDPDLARRAAEEFGTQAFENLDELTQSVDAMTVAVPAQFHRATVVPLLEHGIHVLVEKPLAVSSREGRKMVDAAAAKGVILGVGHVERFNPALSALKDLTEIPAFIEARRFTAFPPPRPGSVPRNCDVSVIFDLMIHDIDLVLALLDAEVQSMHCVGHSVASAHIDVASAWLQFSNGTVVQFHASRVSPDPCRTFVVHSGGSQYCLDLSNGEALVVEPDVDRGVTVTYPTLVTWNALEEELRDFCECVQRRRQGDSRAATTIPGEAGLRAVALAEEIQSRAGWGKGR